jgi:hypothetical protein
MWRPLTALSEVDYQHVAGLRDDNDLELVSVLRSIATRPWAEQLTVLTSMGRLYLTTALNWEDHHQLWTHPEIEIGLTPARHLRVTYSPGSKTEKKRCRATVLKTPFEAANYIDLLMISMQYDAEAARKFIIAARERKAAYLKRKEDESLE